MRRNVRHWTNRGAISGAVYVVVVGTMNIISVS